MPPPSEFIRHVRDALTHLFDAAYLQTSPLLGLLLPAPVSNSRARAQALRELLLHAINDLKPPRDISPHDPAYRAYAVLQHRYAEGFSGQDVQDKLAISRRQFYREQSRACSAVAAMLWGHRLPDAKPLLAGEQVLDQELEEVGLQSEPFCLCETLGQAMAAVRSLAGAHGVVITPVPGPSPMVFADEAVSRQLIVSILSAVVKQHAGTHLRVVLSGGAAAGSERWAALAIEGVSSEAGYGELRQSLRPLSTMATRIGGQLDVSCLESRGRLCLLLPSSQEEVVAIVDDNSKTLRLFQRYLEPYRYRPMLVQDSNTALAQIAEMHPDAIVLDVMMRDTDGWQILQSLKADPATEHIPVVVCSVLNEQELASSIGANAYLRKPVSQTVLVQALALLLRRR